MFRKRKAVKVLTAWKAERIAGLLQSFYTVYANEEKLMDNDRYLEFLDELSTSIDVLYEYADTLDGLN